MEAAEGLLSQRGHLDHASLGERDRVHQSEGDKEEQHGGVEEHSDAAAEQAHGQNVHEQRRQHATHDDLEPSEIHIGRDAQQPTEKGRDELEL